MKNILIIGFSLWSVFAFAQASEQVTELNFCGEQFAVPDGCKADSQYALQCDDVAVQWMYLEQDMLTFLPQQYLDQLDDKLKKFRKDKIGVISLDKEIEGYLVSYKEGKETKYKIIAYGIVNDRPVLINTSLVNEPKSNEDLPIVVKQFIEIKK